jgi:putative cardiolipin synthase
VIPIKNLIAIALPLLLLGGCMKLPENNGRSESRAIPTTEAEQTSLGLQLADKLAAHPGKNGVLMLRSGRDAFVARALLAQQAESSIDLQYYMFHHDTVGNLLINEVLSAAGRRLGGAGCSSTDRSEVLQPLGPWQIENAAVHHTPQ